MPLNQARCFVLRTHAVGETDKVVALFSAEEGKVRAWANRARRPKSRFGGALEVGNEVEAQWFERENRELVTLDRCELVSSALPLVRDPRRGAALGYFSELVALFAGEREPHPKTYRLLDTCRAALLDDRSPLLLAGYFESWLLRLAGLYPRAGVCGCGVEFDAGDALFFPGGPEFRCASCAAGRGEPAGRLTPAGVSLLRRFRAVPPAEAASLAAPAAAAAEEVFRFHGTVVRAAAEHSLPARRLLERALAPAFDGAFAPPARAEGAAGARP